MTTATDYRRYELTGDVLADRAHWTAAGRPADHPYILDCARRVDEPRVVEPLAISLDEGQREAMAVLGPIMARQSAANIAAMLRRGAAS